MEKLDILKKTFKIHFKGLMNLFNDSRAIYFSSNKQQGIFPRIEILLDLHHSVGVFWHKNKIEIQFNDEILEEAYLKNLSVSLAYLKNAFKQIADHEYAHTIQFKSMFFRLPQDTRDNILKKNPEEITKEDLIKSINDSNDRMITEQKNCKNIHFAQIDDVFQDFWANSIVFSKISRIPPKEMLKNRIDGMNDNECLYPNNIIYREIPYNKRVFELLLYTQEFFIFERWDKLENLFNEYNLGRLLRFYRYINLFFRKFLEIDRKLDEMRDNIIDLTLILDRINYNSIIFENEIEKNDIQVLIKFRDHLKEL